MTDKPFNITQKDNAKINRQSVGKFHNNILARISPPWEGGRGGLKALTALFIFLLFCGAVQMQQKPFEILKQRFEDGNVLHADFRYEYEDTFTNQTSANFGKLWISNKQYKVISGEQTIYVDGETSKVYDANRNRVIISKYVEQDDDFAPSRFLNGIDSSYTVVNQAKSKNGFAVELKSQDPFSLYKKITIKVDKQYVPTQIIAIDQSGNIITTSFINASFIKNRQANFYIKYPDEAKVVDLRK